jgi:hypothetical protein
VNDIPLQASPFVIRGDASDWNLMQQWNPSKKGDPQGPRSVVFDWGEVLGALLYFLSNVWWVKR